MSPYQPYVDEKFISAAIRDGVLAGLRGAQDVMRSRVRNETAQVEIIQRPDRLALTIHVSVDVEPRFV